ncbi:hypothetical protein D3C86_1944810 [compost metagenome]
MWNDRRESDLAGASSHLKWSTSTPNLVSVDADGTVRALPNSGGGTAVVTVTANFPVPPTNRLIATPSATVSIPIFRKSETPIEILFPSL